VKYQTIEGILFDLDTLSEEERKLVDDMYRYSLTARSWTNIVQPHIFHGDVIQRSKKAAGANWQQYPLYQINMDLMGRIGVRTGELRQPEKPYPDAIIE